MIIKICGIKRIEDFQFADSLGPEVLGLICNIPESPRSHTLEELEPFFSIQVQAKKALLFRNASPFDVSRFIKTYNPDILHCCGNEGRDFRNRILDEFPELEIWQTQGVNIGEKIDAPFRDEILALLEDDSLSQLVLDTAISGKSGGTGKRFDLIRTSELLGPLQGEIVIAGGLKSENIETSLQSFSPKGVDVSSGVETKVGEKDHNKLKQFIEVCHRH